jgi:hypothetical protein
VVAGVGLKESWLKPALRLEACTKYRDLVAVYQLVFDASALPCMMFGVLRLLHDVVCCRIRQQ